MRCDSFISGMFWLVRTEKSTEAGNNCSRGKRWVDGVKHEM